LRLWPDSGMLLALAERRKTPKKQAANALRRVACSGGFAKRCGAVPSIGLTAVSRAAEDLRLSRVSRPRSSVA
jgi:hypothetical protein